MVVGLRTTPRRPSVLPVIPINVTATPGIPRTTVTARVTVQIKAVKTAIHLTPFAAIGIAVAVAPTPTRTPQRYVWAPVVPTVVPKRKSPTATVQVHVATAAARPAAVVIAVPDLAAPARVQTTVTAVTPMVTTAPVLAASATTNSLVAVPVTRQVMLLTAKGRPFASGATTCHVRVTPLAGIATMVSEIPQCVVAPPMTTTTTARDTISVGTVSKRVGISPASSREGTFQKVYG